MNTLRRPAQLQVYLCTLCHQPVPTLPVVVAAHLTMHAYDPKPARS